MWRFRRHALSISRTSCASTIRPDLPRRSFRTARHAPSFLGVGGRRSADSQGRFSCFPPPSAPFSSTPAAGSGKKTWDMQGCLQDHKEVFLSLPAILGAYVGTHAVAPKLNESIMVTVNSANECPYCEGLHGQLARMAGVEDAQKLQNACSVAEARKLVDEPAVTYARVFAENNGRGDEEKAAYSGIVQHYGQGQARSIRALCWFLQWGSIGGNTLNEILFEQGSKKVNRTNKVFDVCYVIYYGPLFGVIFVMNQGLRFMPRVPEAVSAGIGVMLTFVGGSFIVPVGLVGMLAA